MALVDGVNGVQPLGHLGVPVLGDVLGKRFCDESLRLLPRLLARESASENRSSGREMAVFIP